MIGNFIPCCAFSLAQEGGFSDVPGDPGGATEHGITIAALSAEIGHPATVDDVRRITPSQAQGIYRQHYWAPINGDNLPAGVDLMVFDFGINAGPRTSAMRLQALLGFAEPDGIIGPVTIAAMGGSVPAAIIAALAYSHETYYRGLAGFGEFGAGWLARNSRAQAAAMGMIKSPVA